MKKNIIYGVILVLACALTCTITYILVDNKYENNKTKETNNDTKKEENKDQTTKEDGVIQKSVYALEDKIIEELEVTLNGKTKVMKVNYKYVYYMDVFTHSLLGVYNGANLYAKDIRDDFDSENNKIIPKYKKEDIFSVNSIKSAFSKENYQIIKGTDNKNYLVVMAYNEDSFNELKYYNVYIFNEELDLISKDNIDYSYIDLDSVKNIKRDFFDTTNSQENFVNKAENLTWYKGNYCKVENDFPCYQMFKIENNKIYYLAPKFKTNYKENDYGTVEERVYTINNNKLEYEVINTYKILELGNMT